MSETGALLVRQTERIAELERELTAAQKDAERYRWLRDDDRGTAISTAALWGKHPYTDDERAKGIDAAIDAAIAAEKSTKGE